MKFTVNQSDIKPALARVRSVAKSSGPFANVRIDTVGDGMVRIFGGDGNVQLSVDVKCEVGEQGSMVVDGAKITSFVGVMPGDIQFSGVTNLNIAGIAGKFSLAAFPAEEMPEMSHPGEGAVMASLCSGVIEGAIRQTEYAVYRDSDRSAALRGVNFEIVDGKLTTVATNGSRLATTWCNVEMGACEKRSAAFVVPAAAARIAMDMSRVGRVFIEADDRVATFRGECWSVTTKLVADVYPAWQKVIPPAELLPNHARVDRSRLIQALAMCSLSADLGVNVKFSSGRLEMWSKTELSTARVEVDSDYAGGAVVMKMDPKLVVKALEVSSDNVVDVGFKDANSAVMVTGESPYRVVMMPLRG